MPLVGFQHARGGYDNLEDPIYQTIHPRDRGGKA